MRLNNAHILMFNVILITYRGWFLSTLMEGQPTADWWVPHSVETVVAFPGSTEWAFEFTSKSLNRHVVNQHDSGSSESHC